MAFESLSVGLLVCLVVSASVLGRFTDTMGLGCFLAACLWCSLVGLFSGPVFSHNDYIFLDLAGARIRCNEINIIEASLKLSRLLPCDSCTIM